MARWTKASLPDLWTRLKWALGVAAVAAVILPFILGRWSPLIAAGLFLALWIVVTSVVSGRFPGSPVTLSYRFELHAETIARLEIG